MTALATQLSLPPLAPDRIRERWVYVAWALLALNVLTFYGQAPYILPIPAAVGTLITQSALLGALAVALAVNRPTAIRPSLFLLVLTVLPVQAALISPRAEFMAGSMFRAARLAMFVAVLWALTPWWYRKDLLLVRAHLAVLTVILGTVVTGLLVVPGMAMTDGRLAGVVWPIPWTQVAHYSAVAAGLTAVLWLSGRMRRSVALLGFAATVTLLLLTHTRTALLALVAGLVVAATSLFTGGARVRRAFAAGLAVSSVAALTVSSIVTTWLARGQDASEVGQLTGRTKVWEAVLAAPRSTVENVFGLGLSNKSFNGLPIDSNWLVAYYELGLVGVTVNALLILVVLVSASLRPQGPRRALGLFLAVYCLAASFTETGLSDASAYLLELSLAASLVVAPSERRGLV